MSLALFNGQTLVAEIEAGESGARLSYQPRWRADGQAFPVSLTLPLTAAEHGPDVVLPWLNNLLPEGDALQAMARALGVAQDDVLGVIAGTGQDLAGALSAGRPRHGETPGFTRLSTPRDLERVLDHLPARPFLVGEVGVSMCLAGAQEKLALALIDGQPAIPIGGAASTHILKPDSRRLPGGVQNQALCMVLARRCGLSAAAVTTGMAGPRSYLLVQRFDRAIASGQPIRLHQEDFCQALGLPAAAKYQYNPSGLTGPSLPDMFALLRRHMTARDITGFLDAVIFNVLIGNVESHAKRYAVLLSPRRAELAPLYGLTSGLDRPDGAANQAQDIGGQRRGTRIYGRHWRRMALASGLAGLATVRRVGVLAARVLAELPHAATDVAAMPAGPGDADRLERLVAALAARARLVRDHAAIDGPAEADDTPETAPAHANDAPLSTGRDTPPKDR
jgi:serine/threonine-protein kinase HipA